MAKMTITLEDDAWCLVLERMKPLAGKNEIFRSMLEQFNGHMQGEHVSEELALLDLIVAARAAVNHLETCERGMIHHPFRSSSLPMLRKALSRYKQAEVIR